MNRHLTLVHSTHLHLVPTCGDIGDNPREVEFEPLTEPATVPAPSEPVPA